MTARLEQRSLEVVDLVELRHALVTWWQRARKRREHLPWRSTQDPWEVLVAEVMLAQTQAERVAPHYVSFIRDFPTPKDLARAPAGDVLRAWSGLGYNRRALALRASADQIESLHAGVVPSDLDALMALPGVGPYTARAVASFAFGKPTGVLDTNVGRVLARLLAGAQLTRRQAQELVDRIAGTSKSRSINLALMDLGALVCTARDPDCHGCAFQSRCVWNRQKGPDPAPGSGGVTTRQSRFVGSDRQGRGRVLARACRGPIEAEELETVTGWVGEPERIRRVVGQLIDEGALVEEPAGRFRLP